MAEQLPIPGDPDFDLDLHELELLSNSVLDLVEARRFDEAELVCRELARRWPDQIDAIERMADVHEARGEVDSAIACLERCIIFDRANFEERMGEDIDWYQERIEQLRASRGSRP